MNTAFASIRNLPGNILLKKIPWNISVIIILVLGVTILASFIAYSYAGVSQLQTFQPFVGAPQSVKIETLPPVDLSTNEREEFEAGVDERETVFPDEIIAPNVGWAGMPPLAIYYR